MAYNKQNYLRVREIYRTKYLLAEEEAEGHDRSLEATCRFCNAAYRFGEEELLGK